MPRIPPPGALPALALALAASGCAGGATGEPAGQAAVVAASPSPDGDDGPPGTRTPVPEDGAPARKPDPSGETGPSGSAAPARPRAGDGRPRRALLTVPALGIHDLPVLPYRGRTDDAPGTAIQDRGLAASPHGPRGGTGPGGTGNYQVTAHRLSSTRAFELLPDLRRGQRVLVDAGARRYVYRVTATRETSFRSPVSLRRQRAAVPGRPGVEPTRAMITLSTCATPEDHAAGNWWSDRFGNPEHRIDKVGVLVRTVARPGA